MGRGEHERFDCDRNNFRNSETLPDIDIVEISHFDTIDGDDIARNLELIFQNPAQGFRDIEV